MIRGVLVFAVTAFFVGGIGLAVASRRADAATRRRRLLKFATYFLIVLAFLFAAFLGRLVLASLCAAVCVAGAAEIWRAMRAIERAWRAPIAISYGVLSASLVAFAIVRSPERVVFAYIIVAAFDGFSQVVGQLIGRTPLVPRISPGKTVEGATGGLVAALATAVSLRSVAGFGVTHALLVCIAVVSAALAGDLAASWIKRRARLKDFGDLVPGHGGVLDRFDSLLGAAPVAWLLL